MEFCKCDSCNSLISSKDALYCKCCGATICSNCNETSKVCPYCYNKEISYKI